MKPFTPAPLYPQQIIGIVRIVVGLLITYHGLEIFNKEIMNGYLTWDVFKFSNAETIVYLGKASELLSGILLVLGLFTRVGALLCIGTLSYVTFVVGHGKFWYDDQHPFLFVLFGVFFFFTGPGKWSLDGVLFISDLGASDPPKAEGSTSVTADQRHSQGVR
jgi:putative oxidoreductase